MRLRELQLVYRPVAGTLPGPRPRLMNARSAADVLRPLIEDEAVEVFGALFLNTKHEPLAWHVVSRGTLDSTLVHPRDVLKAACLANAASLILAHNHPSGDPTPSPDDIQLTSRLVAAGLLVGIEVLDHVVIGHEGRFCSLRETRLL